MKERRQPGMLLVNETQQQKKIEAGEERKGDERKEKEIRIDKETEERKGVSRSVGPNSAICTPDQTAELGLREHTNT